MEVKTDLAHKENLILKLSRGILKKKCDTFNY